ncbi:hypothetical protein GYH30_045317 [Glycine max]|nr:hypothetical protein GYH30_045317 [Glycine max]
MPDQTLTPFLVPLAENSATNREQDYAVDWMTLVGGLAKSSILGKCVKSLEIFSVFWVMPKGLLVIKCRFFGKKFNLCIHLLIWIVFSCFCNL